MMFSKADFRNATMCAVICLAALLLAWPFANLSFNDDWTWALTVKQLRLQHHLVYNGWSSPSVIGQAYWGLLWQNIFGESFIVLKISSLPMAAGCVVMTYALARRSGLNAQLACFAALTLGLSPIFMPMACSFMTDVPGLFFFLLSLYAIVRGAETDTTGSAIGWILTGVVAGLIGGSSRQVVWIVPLMALPYFAYLRRSDRTFAITAAIAWLVVFGGAAYMQHWFAQQPFSVPDPPTMSYVKYALHHPKTQVIALFWVSLTLTIMLLPIAIAGMRRLSIVRSAVAAVLFLIMLGVAYHYSRWMMPWMGNVFTISGVLGSVELYGDRAVFFIRPVRRVIGLIVMATSALLLASAILWLVRQPRVGKKIVDYFLQPANRRGCIQVMLITVAAYLTLELTRCIFNVAFDRHLLPLIPLAGIPILFCFQNAGYQRMPAFAWATLILFGVYGLASTQEVNSLARARVVAIQRLKDAGVPAEQIDGGFEYTYWTQADKFGHINDARLRNPPGIYNPNQSPIFGMNFKYRLEASPQRDVTATSEFGIVDYFSLLPPFHRQVWIDRFTGPPPASHQMLPKILIEQYATVGK